MAIYVDAATFVSYAADRGVTLDLTKAAVEIRKAQDYIDMAYQFNGTPVSNGSAFPRSGLEHYDNTTVPYPIKNATMLVAMLSVNGANIYAGTTTAPVKRETIASNRIETEYDTETNSLRSATDVILFPSITRLLDEAALLAQAATIINNFYGMRG